MSLPTVLLGLLAAGPAHGYDLKHAYDAQFPSSRPLAFGQVYAALAKLADAGSVEVAETKVDGGPERTVYAITASGRAIVEEWLSATEPAGPYAADDLVRKTVLALNLQADPAGFLDRQRAIHLARMKHLLAEQDAATVVGHRIALDHTINHLDADLKWLELAAERIGRPATSTQNGGAA